MSQTETKFVYTVRMNRSRAYLTLMLIFIWRNKATLESTCKAEEAFTLVFDDMIIRVSVIKQRFSLGGFAMKSTQPLGVTLFSVNRQLTQKKY